MNGTNRGQFAGRVIVGMLMIACGGLVLLGRMHILAIGSLWRLWPLIIVAVGTGRLLNPDLGGLCGAGPWMILTGAWLLIANLGLLGLTLRGSWPLLAVALGALLVAQAIVAGSNRSDSSTTPQGR